MDDSPAERRVCARGPVVEALIGIPRTGMAESSGKHRAEPIHLPPSAHGAERALITAGAHPEDCSCSCAAGASVCAAVAAEQHLTANVCAAVAAELHLTANVCMAVAAALHHAVNVCAAVAVELSHSERLRSGSSRARSHGERLRSCSCSPPLAGERAGLNKAAASILWYVSARCRGGWDTTETWRIQSAQTDGGGKASAGRGGRTRRTWTPPAQGPGGPE